MASLSDVPKLYFMPALLNPFHNDISLDVKFGSQAFTTLYVKFNNGYFPRGVFCCLIALCVKRNMHWKLQVDSSYKDLVVFQIDSNGEYLILSDKIHYISVEIHRKEKLLQNKHQALFCMLYENLKDVCSTIHLDGEFTFGFLCRKETCKKFASVQYPYSPENLLCSVCKYNLRMTYDQLVWFISPNVVDVYHKVRSYFCVIKNACVFHVHIHIPRDMCFTAHKFILFKQYTSHSDMCIPQKYVYPEISLNFTSSPWFKS